MDPHVTFEPSRHSLAVRTFLESRNIRVGPSFAMRAIETAATPNDHAGPINIVLQRLNGPEGTRGDRCLEILTILSKVERARMGAGMVILSPDDLLEMFSSRAIGRHLSYLCQLGDPSLDEGVISRSPEGQETPEPFPYAGVLASFLRPALSGSLGTGIRLLSENLLVSVPGLIRGEFGTAAPFREESKDTAVAAWVRDMSPAFNTALDIDFAIYKTFWDAEAPRHMAKRVQEIFRVAGHEIKLGHCHEMVALCADAKSWNVLSARLVKIEAARAEEGRLRTEESARAAGTKETEPEKA